MKTPTLFLAGILAAATLPAAVSFDSFVIRNTPTIQGNNDYVSGALEFIIDGGGDKAALGTNAVNGALIGQLVDIGITRYDDTSRFTAGSGPAVAPYFNIWVTDGNGKYAVLANEPSNGSFAAFRSAGPGNGLTYDFTMADIANEPVQVYETPNGGHGSTSTWVHDLFGNQPLKFSDVGSLEIAAPSSAYISNGANAVGGGAPDELGTNDAYGFNWVFGDTLSNYVSGQDGYIVSNASVNAIPEPSTIIGLIGTGLLALVIGRRLWQNAKQE